MPRLHIQFRSGWRQPLQPGGFVLEVWSEDHYCLATLPGDLIVHVLTHYLDHGRLLAQIHGAMEAEDTRHVRELPPLSGPERRPLAKVGDETISREQRERRRAERRSRKRSRQWQIQRRRI